MNFFKKIALCLTLVCAGVLMSDNAFAGDTKPEIKTRMTQRVGQIDSLKRTGVIGENNKGFLEIREKGTPAAEAVIAGENRDRGLIYAMIAKETGSTADTVGKARAKQIARDSAAGVWVQDENGNWKKK